MPYEKKALKIFQQPLDTMFTTAIHTIQYMGGKVIKQDQAKGILIAQMDKKLFGDYLGDRSQLEITFTEPDDRGIQIELFAFPLNAIGQKLMFGARDGVVETIIRTFFIELEKRL